ncbi:MAG TPA: TonB-dependent receptor [Flavobacteriales bacterium]|nr:TonB-dependent receptor [Flavobacteriales bacterium]HIA12760.1 TonB-dependent receptor [Flavobacteriales bacterium]HIO72214.1 TonB-dependent receptor [Flavobacteriales bacterium]
MFRRFAFACLLVLFTLVSYSQKHYTISGYVKDAQTGEDLIAAAIYVDEIKNGVLTNIYGFYSITLDSGIYNIHISYLGYTSQPMTIELNKNTKLPIELEPASEELNIIDITADRMDENVRSTQMSSIKMDIQEIKSLPVLFGEVDVMKTLSLMPGVSTNGEGSTGLHVRGGSPDQNLILLDEAPVYNASHLLGFFSVFNSDAIKDVKLIKGGIPANYGGRISSVLDIKMNEGNSKKLSTTGGIGLIASRLTIEGPIIKNKSSFIISGRRTYADLFLLLSDDEEQRSSKLYFYDLNLKANYRFSDKDRLYLSGYFGRDVFGFGDQFSFDWGNATGTLRWNHLFSDKLFMNTMFVFSDYSYKFSVKFDEDEISLNSGIQDYILKADMQLFPNVLNNLKFGISTTFHRFSPPSFTSNIPGYEEITIQKRYALESGIYLLNEHIISDKLSAHYGLRYSMFNLMGPVDDYTLDEERENVTDTNTYKAGNIFKTYGGLEPRLAISYLLNEKSSMKLSYNRTMQYIHLLSNTGSSSPTDLWIPSSAIVKPQIGDQVALGYFRNFKENVFETSVEVYYKYLQNQIDYKPGANIQFNETIETELLFGTGESFGLELLAKKSLGRFTGWVAYTLSRTTKKLKELNKGESYPVRHDRIHDISIVSSYTLSPNWKIAATWVYSTGNAITFPAGKYEYGGQVVSYYTERNGYRMPDYHRMDISATFERNRKGKNFQSSWSFSIYNVYARQNAYSIRFQQSEDDPNKTEAVQLSLFTIVPSVTWNFKF